MRAEYKRKSALALGVCCICLVFLLETWVADRRMPNAASPFIWTVLGAAAVIALALAWRYRVLANRKEPS
jgi:tryptophan-rich sensory protein